MGGTCCTNQQEAQAEPFWFSHRFTVKDFSFYETWHYNLKLNRVRDIVSDRVAAASSGQPIRSYIQDFIEDTLDVSPAGFLRDSGGKKHALKKLLDQYEKFVSAIPEYMLSQASKGAPSKFGRYSRVAGRLMRGMGWDGEGGLGSRGQGIASPVRAQGGNRNRAGLGAVPTRHKPHAPANPPSQIVCFLNPSVRRDCLRPIQGPGRWPHTHPTISWWSRCQSLRGGDRWNHLHQQHTQSQQRTYLKS